MSSRLGMLGLFGLLVAVGAAAWWLALRTEPVADPSTLSRLPSELGAWRSEDQPLDETVEAMLQADYNLQRRYESADGEFLWLYVGYYGTRRGGTPEHVPTVCYASAGWEVGSHRVISVGGRDGMQVNEMVVGKGADRRLVLYWFRSYRSPALLTPLRLELDHAVGRLLDGRGDGALVRLSAPIAPWGIEAVRRRLSGFAVRLEPLLAQSWPPERRP